MAFSFQLTRLMRGVTGTHRFNRVVYRQFQLTRLMRGVTQWALQATTVQLSFQLTRLMRGVTVEVNNAEAAVNISTHTPHARRDPSYAGVFLRSRIISTHTPHARRDCLCIRQYA